MLPISRITSPITTLWRNMPVGSTCVCLTALSIAIATRFTSDRRIHATIALAAGVLIAAQIVMQVIKDQIEELRVPPPQPVIPKQRDLQSYLNLLSNDILQRTGNFLDYSTQRILTAQALSDYSLDQMRLGLNADIDSQKAAERALEMKGIFVCPGESALDTLRRHYATIAPESRLFQGIKQTLKANKLGLFTLTRSVIGPLLIVEEQRGIVAYHWPTGTVKWIQPDKTLPNYRLDYRTGEATQNSCTTYYTTFEQIENRGPRTLFDINHQVEITLTHDCERVLSYRHPYLVFVSEGKVWIKNGASAEFPIDIPGNTFTALFFQPPYMIGNTGFGNEGPPKLYSLLDGKQLFEFTEDNPLLHTASIQQRSNPDSDILYYHAIGEGGIVRAKQLSLRDLSSSSAQTKYFPRSAVFKEGSMLVDYLSHINMSLGIHYPERPFIYHCINLRAVKVAAIYNGFVLLYIEMFVGVRKYFVLDLAENSLPNP